MGREPSVASAQASTVAKVKLPREQDPRNPNKRLAAFFDPDTVELITADDDSGILAAIGRVEGQPVVAFSSDATVQGGAMGVAGCKAILVAYERALADGVPVVGIWHSGGARLAEGVVSLHAVGEVFAIMTRASGKVPQISIVIGAAAGGAAYGPALTDIVILGPEGRVFVTGPDVVRSVTGEAVDALRLGGPEPHGRRSGVAHVTTPDDESALATARQLAALLGRQGRLSPADLPEEYDLSALLPAE
ncbi:MAG TPA: carboxyl transferase domain-containing protein, partial [Intrasporangium sp.]|uniref:carboxyl transferase domain-containing protein n=1 Tax=Intrasporangium sp. TaxID=1925024 RepID=UPI002D787BB5